MHIDKKAQILTGIMMSGAMAFMLSGFFTWLNLGFTTIWVPAWGRSFIQGWSVALVASMILGPRIAQLAGKIVRRLA